MQNRNKGITLVALVITIIILLILAGISIATLSQTGLFQKAKEAKEKLGISSQISDVDFVKDLIKEVFSENEDAIISYKEGKGRALGFLVGQVMKKSKGRVNPKLTTELVTEELERR